MTNTFDYTNLKSYMIDKGINERFLSIKTGIPESKLLNVLNGQAKFTSKDVQAIIGLFSKLFDDFTPEVSDTLLFQTV